MIKQMRKRLFGLSRHARLPHMARTLTADFDVTELDPEIELVLMSGLVRNPVEAQRLMEEYNAQTAAQLFARLPPPRRVADWRARLRAWLISLEGAYQHDPHKKEFGR